MKRRGKYLALMLCLALMVGLAGPTAAAGSRVTDIDIGEFDGNGGVYELDEGHNLRHNGVVCFENVAQFSTTDSSGLMVRTDGTAWQWGGGLSERSGTSQLSYPRPLQPKQVMEQAAWVQSTEQGDLILKTDHSLWLFSYFTKGQWVKIADGVSAAQLSGWGVDLHPSRFNVLTVDASGVLELLLLDGKMQIQRVRVDDGMTGAVCYGGNVGTSTSITLGVSFYGIKKDGSLWYYTYRAFEPSGEPELFPDEYYGGGVQLGTGVGIASARLLDSVASVTSDGMCSMAVKTDGSLWVWGDVSRLSVLTPGDHTQSGITFQRKPAKLMDGIKQVCLNDDGYHLFAALKANGEVVKLLRGEPALESSLAHTAIAGGPIRYDLGYDGYVTFQSRDGALWAEGILHNPKIQRLRVSVGENHTDQAITPAAAFSMRFEVVPADLGSSSKIDVVLSVPEQGRDGADRPLCLVRVTAAPDGTLTLKTPPSYDAVAAEMPGFYDRKYSDMTSGFKSTGPDMEVLYGQDSEKARALTYKIVGDAVDDAEKYWLIHNWILDNISVGGTAGTPDECIEMGRTFGWSLAMLEYSMLLEQDLQCLSLPVRGEGGICSDIRLVVNIHNQWVLSQPGHKGWGFDGDHISFYGSRPSGPDATEFYEGKYSKPQAETLSPWAVKEASAANAAGLVPTQVWSRTPFQFAIHRDDFCNLIVHMVMKVKGDTIYNFAEREKLTVTDPFVDTSRTEVLYAHAMGIVTGVAPDRFYNRFLSLTRQEAATILQRTAAYLDLDVPNETPEIYTDAGSIASWAKAGVDFASAAKDPASGNKVMGGIGGGQFSPEGDFSVEQAILSVSRLYRAAIAGEKN